MPDRSPPPLIGWMPGAVVLTTDHLDFSVYRVPFVSPRGEFHG
jgi:hypothetical protein